MLRIVVPARSGSKGVPGKNLRLLNGFPLTLHTLEAAHILAHCCNEEARYYLTSDSPQILSLAERSPGCIPIHRPKELSLDTSLTSEAVMHAADSMGFNKDDIIVLLQPTCPDRPYLEIADIADIINKKLRMDRFNSIVSLVDVEGYHPFRMKRLLHDGTCISLIDQGFEDMRPRQVLPKCYIRSGSYYITRASSFLESHKLVNEPTYGYLHTHTIPVNIDSELDFTLASLIIKKRKMS